MVNDRIAQARKLAAEARQQALLESAMKTVAKGLEALAQTKKAGAGATSSQFIERDSLPVIVVHDELPGTMRDEEIAAALRDDGCSESEIEAVLMALPQDAGPGHQSAELAAWISEIMGGRDDETDAPARSTPEKSSRSLASAETACLNWLLALAKADGGKDSPKQEIWATAQEKFSGLSKRAFDRQWDKLVEKFPAWGKAGRPRNRLK